MRCPSCGGAELKHDKRDVPYTFKGETTVFENIEGDYCPNCGESLHGPVVGEKLSRMAMAFNKRCDPLPDEVEEWVCLLSQDDGEAALEHLAAGNPIYYREADTPQGVCIKEFPNGRRELVRFDLESGKEVVVSTLANSS
jgi:YgiT-type zinc finger domain-containing protein